MSFPRDGSHMENRKLRDSLNLKKTHIITDVESDGHHQLRVEKFEDVITRTYDKIKEGYMRESPEVATNAHKRQSARKVEVCCCKICTATGGFYSRQLDEFVSQKKTGIKLVSTSFREQP